MAKKLHYFGINGLGEGIRYLLHYGQVEFEDVRYEFAKWDEEKSMAPFGQLPLYEEGNKGYLNQSLAIYRYIGQSLNLGFGDPFEDAQLDALALTISEMLPKIMPIFSAGDLAAREAFVKTYLCETVVFFYSRFEKQVKEHNGFLFGKLTWVDFVLLGVTELLDLLLDTSVESNYPSIQALLNKIHDYPGIKKYVATRKPYQNPLNKQEK